MTSKINNLIGTGTIFFQRDEGAGTKRKRKTKQDKDPNKPKRAQSAYMLWLADNREKIKTDNPGISFTDIVKKAGEIWRTLTSDDKKVTEMCCSVKCTCL